MKILKKLVVLVSLVCVSIFYGCSNGIQGNNSYSYNYDDVKDALIRFHVLANSDSDKDQALKIKVKDKVIEYLYPLLDKSKSIKETEKILLSNKEKIKEIAQQVISSQGYNYSVNLQLSRENFPVKSYGSIILPQGNYEAFRIIIGSGEGQNWWCVMFPPLCFIDVTKGKVEDNSCKKRLDKQIKISKHKQQTKLKFKSVEIFKEIFK